MENHTSVIKKQRKLAFSLIHHTLNHTFSYYLYTHTRLTQTPVLLKQYYGLTINVSCITETYIIHKFNLKSLPFLFTKYFLLFLEKQKKRRNKRTKRKK